MIMERQNTMRSVCLAGLLAVLPMVAVRADVKTESKHSLTTEVGVGYSSLLTNSDYGKAAGLVGGLVQVGYEWQYRNFLLHTGVEFSSINSIGKVDPFRVTVPYTMGLPAGMSMDEHFAFSDYKETELMGQVNIPVMVGGSFSDRWFFLVGAKIGLPVIHSATARTNLATSLTDPTLVGEIGDNGQVVMPHDVYASELTSESMNWKNKVIHVQASAEVGMILNSFMKKDTKKTGSRPVPSSSRNQKKTIPITYRLSLFCDYGITSCSESGESALVQAAAPREVQMNPLLETGSRTNSLLVGVKFAMLFQLNQPKTPVKKEIISTWLDVAVRDAETQQPLSAMLTITDKKSGRQYQSEVKNGAYHKKTRVGSFDVVARANEHYPDTLSYTVAQAGDDQSLSFALRPVPKPKQDTVIFEDIVVEKGRAIVLHNLFFATNQTTILPESEPLLDDLYEMLQANPDSRIRIIGHTDNIGSARSNQILSEGRAKSVKQALVKRGIDASRIETMGKGESQPIDTNATEQGRQNNRRVEFVLL